MWDAFISHAWEDKEDIARPLAEGLRRAGLRVWYDEFTLRVGDRLLRSIDHGLANSRYGIVILSPNFFAKEWAQKELAGLAAREVPGEKVILPIWHNITADQIREFSPTLADRVAVLSNRGLEHVVKELLRVINKKADLIAQMGSTVPDVAIAAVEELRRHGWLYDGSLRGAILNRANLQGANLEEANLQGANLEEANLQEAILDRANLQGAKLQGANLQKAMLEGANLRGAKLQGAELQAWLVFANLQEANLQGANLEGASLAMADLPEANLSGANLEWARMHGADLEGIECNERTILPDGAEWTPDTDMARFTDLGHPDFWSPDT